MIRSACLTEQVDYFISYRGLVTGRSALTEGYRPIKRSHVKVVAGAVALVRGTARRVDLVSAGVVEGRPPRTRSRRLLHLVEQHRACSHSQMFSTVLRYFAYLSQEQVNCDAPTPRPSSRSPKTATTPTAPRKPAQHYEGYICVNTLVPFR